MPREVSSASAQRRDQTAFALLITASSLLPWYVVWLLPLAALATDRRLWRLAIVTTGLVEAIQLIGYLPHVALLGR